MYRVSIVLGLFVLIGYSVFGQTEEVNKYLKMVANGRTDEVKMLLPDLMAEYHGDPGVELLHGVVIEDAVRALDIYKDIVKKYPESEWADDALWRIVQFYAVTGDTTDAQKNLQLLRQNYPASEYLAPATDVVMSAIRIERMEKKPEFKKELQEAYGKKTEKPAAMANQAAAKKPAMNNEAADQIAKKQEPESLTPEKKEAPKEEPLENKPPDIEGNSGTYGLQVGIYRTKDAAEAEMNKFLRQRLRTEVLEKVVDGEPLWAVVIGNYTSKESAEAAKQIVEQQCNCKPLVFEK